MDFSLSEERKMLQETVALFFENNYKDIKKRDEHLAMNDGFSRQFWKESADLGVISGLISPNFGGFGGSGEDISIIFELIGKSLCVEPFLSSGVLSSSILSSIKDPRTQIINKIIGGELLISFAHMEMNSRYDDYFVESKATFENDNWRIGGSKSFVINGYTAAELNFDNLNAELLCEDNLANDCIIKANSAGALALSAEAVGIMQVCFDLTLDYLKTRNQFGKSIGAFQSIQHRMVDMMLEIEQVRSAVMLASSTFETNSSTRDKNVSAAKNLVGRVGKLIAEESIQLHGGIAMTWEYSVAHYAKRLIMIDHLMGDADYHRDRFKLLSSI